MTSWEAKTAINEERALSFECISRILTTRLLWCNTNRRQVMQINQQINRPNSKGTERVETFAQKWWHALRTKIELGQNICLNSSLARESKGKRTYPETSDQRKYWKWLPHRRPRHPSKESECWQQPMLRQRIRSQSGCPCHLPSVQKRQRVCLLKTRPQECKSSYGTVMFLESSSSWNDSDWCCKKRWCLYQRNRHTLLLLWETLTQISSKRRTRWLNMSRRHACSQNKRTKERLSLIV